MPVAGPSTPRRLPWKTKVVVSETEDDTEEANGVIAEGNISDEDSMIQVQFKALMRNVHKLEISLRETRRENMKLEYELNIYKEGAPTTPRRRAIAHIENTGRMQELEEKIEKLEERNIALSKRIKKLRRDQLKAETDALNHEAVDGVGDPDGFNRMRKLLRKFATLMSMTTLVDPNDPKEQKDSCPVCLEEILPTKGYAMSCEHLICIECLANISKGTDETVHCPMCRRIHRREDLQLLRYSETERWDELLTLANESSSMDYGGGTTTSEEEEEDFIDDDEDRESRTEAPDQDAQGDGKDNEDRVKKEEPLSPRLTPERLGSNSYANSPTSEKRKRMENLMQSRSTKKRRI